MARNLLDVAAGSTLVIDFNTVDPESLVPFTLAGSPAVGVWKDGVKLTLTTAPDLYVDKENASSGASEKTGSHWIVIDLANDDADYTAGSDYVVKLTAGTVNGYSVADQTVATFTIENRRVNALKDGVITADTYGMDVATEADIATAVGVELAADFTAIPNAVVKKLGVSMTLTESSTTTSLVVDDAPAGLTTTQIDDALVLHLSSGAYSRVTAVGGTAPNLTLTISPALPATPANDSEIVVFGKYLASL